MTSAVTMLPALVRIPIDLVEPGPNARGDIGDVSELATSIQAIGMQQPLLVSAIGDGRYRILEGHRRHVAAKQIGLPYVDAVLRRDAGGAGRIQQQLAMHAQAKSFDAIAEARALSKLMFNHNLSREEIAHNIGKSPDWVRDRIGLLQLDEAEQQAVRQGTMSIASAKAIVNMRRAQRDGREPVPAQDKQPKSHCRTCTCHQEVARG